MSDMMTQLLIECSEGLDLIDRHLVTLETNPGNNELLIEVFRVLHTIKGSGGFHGLDRLEQVAHSAENLLSLLRDGDLIFTRPIADALLATVDALRAILGTVERTGGEGDPQIDDLTRRLDALASQGPSSADDAAERDRRADDGVDPGQVEPWPEADETEETDETEGPLDDAEEHNEAVPAPTPTGQPKQRLGDLLVTAGAVDRAAVEQAAREQRLGDPRPIGDILLEQGSTTADAIERAAASQAGPTAIDSTIRVDVRLLDDLMNLVGELVLSRNEMVRLATEHDDPIFGPPSQRLNLITSELQEGIMRTRMQPINSAWSKLPRIVRDLSQQLDKEIDVEMIGRETELDRTIIEAIRDPLTHIVRNIVDHGIESPEHRENIGKDRRGTLTLRAGHEGEQVNIEISDDGRGIDPERILASAIERGLIDTKEAEELTEAEIVKLIFRPGLSTAEAITNLSGRGVGMDVVKSNIERIGGSVDLRTERGRGTTFAIKIPLTLAIIPALTVRAGDARYAIPQVNVLELVRLRAGGKERIEDIHGAPVFRLRGKLLPIVDLREQLDLEPAERRTIHIAVVKTETLRFGLVVDGIEDNGEIVVKPLGHQVNDLELFSGATILGDGKVALILDLLGLADRAGLIGAGPTATDEAAHLDADDFGHRSLDAEAIIVLSVGGGERVAIELTAIDRLEEIPASSIERSDGRPVVQYRGTLMPLIDLGQVIGLGGSVLADAQGVNVVVCLSGGRTIGLAVDEILDIVHSDTVQPTGKPGTIIVDGLVTDMIAPETVIAAALPGLHRLDEAGDFAPSAAFAAGGS